MKLSKIIKISVFLFVLCFTIESAAQFSKTHYIPPITAHVDHDTSSPKEQYLYISTPSTTAFNVKITPIGGAPVTLTISNSTPIEYVIRERTEGEDNNSEMFSQLIIPSSSTGGKFNNLGYVIEAEDLVYVSVRILAGVTYNQAGALVSKGLSALGTTFRVGTLPSPIRESDHDVFINGKPDGGTFNDFTSFVSVMATKDNTVVDFSDFNPGVSILNNTPTSVVLNHGESYIIALQTNERIENFDGLIGVLVQSTKPIAVNCGSFNGTSFTSKGSRDIGIDQIVPIERIGQEYIFVKANGTDNIEKPLIVAHQDNTDVFIDGGMTPIATLNAGDYLLIDGTSYGANGNMYVNTSKDVYAYQGVGGTDAKPNQGMFFVPPLSCRTPNIVNDIPFVKNIGHLGVIDIYESDGVTLIESKNVSEFEGGLTIVTEAGSTVTINGTSIFSLGVLVVQQTVTGNSNYETYYIKSLPSSIENVSIESTGQLYVASFGANGSAAFGGFYSGFEFKPEIVLTNTSPGSSGACIPNIQLSINDLFYHDSYQWYLDGVSIPGATSSIYTPSQAGYYHVEGEIINCVNVASDVIPISNCSSDIDNDGVNDNIDIDNDNDGLVNCNESNGNQDINLTNISNGEIPVVNISFTGLVSPASSSSFISGDSDGHFTSDILSNTNLEYQMDFDSPINVSLEFAENGTINLNGDETFSVTVPIINTITLLDPNDEILVDTNYDGIYESGVTQFSSFDIRFKIKDLDLSIGNATFGFYSNSTSAFTFKHTNETLSSSNSNSRFKIIATCVPLDSDNDGVVDALDLDSDNDGIPDIVEGSGTLFSLSGNDANQDGLDDAFDSGITPLDSDTDGVNDYQDLDSDNDGIFDLEESDSFLPDLDFDGIVDNANSIIGVNGWVDTAETGADSGLINYTVIDTDSDGDFNYFDIDSDNDGCSDVTEAGFTDDGNGRIIGTSTNINGVVIGSDGYITPNQDYVIAVMINITTQPLDQEICEFDTVNFDIDTDAELVQWQLFDGANWIDISEGAIYSGTTSLSLTISNVTFAFNGNRYRVLLSSSGNGCGMISDESLLNIIQAVIPTLDPQGNEFCMLDIPTISDLNDNVTPSNGGEIVWYDSYPNGTVLSLTDLLVDGTSYYAAENDGSGCASLTGLEVTAIIEDCQEYDIVIYDGFSPNGDGRNETFLVVQDVNELYPDYNIEIFNRWGHSIFKGSGTNFWNGEMDGNGKVLPTGVYYFILHFNKDNRKPEQRSLYLSR